MRCLFHYQLPSSTIQISLRISSSALSILLVKHSPPFYDSDPFIVISVLGWRPAELFFCYKLVFRFGVIDIF